MGTERSGPITLAIEDSHQSAYPCFVIGGQLHRPAGPRRCRDQISGLFSYTGKGPGSRSRKPSETLTLMLQPAVELG